MRNVINKGLTEEDILGGAGQAFDGGWNKVKLTFMLGLPTETEEDMKEIAVLADKIARRYYEIQRISAMENVRSQPVVLSLFRNRSLHSSGRRCENTEYIARAAIVKHAFQDQLNRKSLKYNWHDAEVTVLEGISCQRRPKGLETD